MVLLESSGHSSFWGSIAYTQEQKLLGMKLSNDCRGLYLQAKPGQEWLLSSDETQVAYKEKKRCLTVLVFV